MLIAYSKTSQAGLTLIEIMIACVIVAIIAAVGLPWYGDHTRRSRVVEGTELAALARVRASELVTIGQVSNSGVTPLRMYSAPRMVSSEWQPPEPQSEVISSNPSAYVTQILRVDASYVVTYSPKLDPSSNQIYSLVYHANVDNGTVTWTCLAGTPATEDIRFAQQHSRDVDLGQPLPARLAPSGCSNG